MHGGPFCGDAPSAHGSPQAVGVVGTAEGLAVCGHTAHRVNIGGTSFATGIPIAGAADGGRQQRPARRAVHLAVDVVGLGVGRALPRQQDPVARVTLGTLELHVVRRGGGRRHLGGDAGGGHGPQRLAVGGHATHLIAVFHALLYRGVLVAGALDGGGHLRPAAAGVRRAVDVVGHGVGRRVPTHGDAGGVSLGRAHRRGSGSGHGAVGDGHHGAVCRGGAVRLQGADLVVVGGAVGEVGGIGIAGGGLGGHQAVCAVLAAGAVDLIFGGVRDLVPLQGGAGN